jgi:Cof subfamily protein (haloacid dehalogenase superfamily)
MYKLLCLDMDGTLLNNEGKVSERNLEAIKRAHEKGVKVTVCTGRLFTSAKLYADLIEVKVPVIASNGAYIKEKDKDEVIYKSKLGIDNLKIILDVLRKYNIKIYFTSDDTAYVRKFDTDNGYVRINKTLPKDKQIKVVEIESWDMLLHEYNADILKCICVDKNTEEVLKAKKELLKYNQLEVVSSMPNNFEVMNKGVSKGRAVEILAGFYNLNREEIMCIGDNENDISMIEYAGMGIAMGNGEKFVKEAADFVTDTNNNHGVAKAIERFIL